MNRKVENILACPKCGSKNVSVENFIPASGILGKMLSLAKKAPVYSSGQQIVKCRECGYKSLLMVR